LPVNRSGIAGNKTVFSQNQPEIKGAKKRQKSERSSNWAAALQDAALNGKIQSAPLHGLTGHNPQLASQQFWHAGDKTVFSQNQPEIGEQLKKGKNQRGAQTGLLHCRKPL
jgi:hypothetical protein